MLITAGDYSDITDRIWISNLGNDLHAVVAFWALGNVGFEANKDVNAVINLDHRRSVRLC
jgi:hypothetical protein